MKILRQNHRWLFAVLVMVFFTCARAGSVAHAAKYGSAPHDHDSAICVFSVLSDEDDDDLALPPEQIILSAPPCLFTYEYTCVENIWASQAILQRARAPPGQ